MVLLWRLENRLTFYVYPVRCLSGNVTANAIYLVISRHLVVGCVSFEKRPLPPITPQ